MNLIPLFLFLFLFVVIIPISDSDYRCADYGAVFVIGKCVLPPYDAPPVIVIR